MSETIKKMIKNPNTGKRMKYVYVTIENAGWFSWNSVYHVYNSVKNFSQLESKHIFFIDYNAKMH